MINTDDSLLDVLAANETLAIRGESSGSINASFVYSALAGTVEPFLVAIRNRFMLPANEPNKIKTLEDLSEIELGAIASHLTSQFNAPKVELLLSIGKIATDTSGGAWQFKAHRKGSLTVKDGKTVRKVGLKAYQQMSNDFAEICETSESSKVKNVQILSYSIPVKGVDEDGNETIIARNCGFYIDSLEKIV